MMKWNNNIKGLLRILESISITDSLNRKIDPDAAFSQWQMHIIQIRENKGTVFLIGNGASASMASHMAADLSKNAHVRTEVFSDLSLITAIANDLSYEDVFAEPLSKRMLPDDMLVAISSSGNSPNIVRAVGEAKRRKGKVVTLSGMSEDNSIRSMGDLNFYIPAQTYGYAETGHAAILHFWTDMVVENSNAYNNR